MKESTVSWPELTYRFIEHYKWEPQHLRGSPAEFYARIRRQEVPLNFVLNLALRLSSHLSVRKLLSSFEPQQSLPASGDFQLLYPEEISLVQPDVRIESETSRIFIEVKVDAAIKLEQVQKYILLHAAMNERYGHKTPHVFFLTAKDFGATWSPSNERGIASDLKTFLQSKLQTPLSNRLLKFSESISPLGSYDSVREQALFAATTWAQLADTISCVADELDENDIGKRVLRDFRDDLASRGLA